MSTVVREYHPDYGGLEVWAEGDGLPVYFSNGVFDQAVFDTVIARRAAEALEHARRTLMREARDQKSRDADAVVEYVLNAGGALSADALVTAFERTLVDYTVDPVLDPAQTAPLMDACKTARRVILTKLKNLFDEARQYIIDNPSVTGAQLKTAFVNKLKAWTSTWTGN